MIENVNRSFFLIENTTKQRCFEFEKECKKSDFVGLSWVLAAQKWQVRVNLSVSKTRSGFFLTSVQYFNTDSYL